MLYSYAFLAMLLSFFHRSFCRHHPDAMFSCPTCSSAQGQSLLYSWSLLFSGSHQLSLTDCFMKYLLLLKECDTKHLVRWTGR